MKFKLILSAGILALSGAVHAYDLDTSLDCSVAADVFDPAFSDCVGAYVLGRGENDVTSGGEDDIVNQILNVENVFGSESWSFLGKEDDSAGSRFFSVLGLGSTTGSIVFDADAINDAFGSDFLTTYDVAISFKSGKSFSVYEWDAALGTDTIAWSTEGTSLNRRDAPKALSHASVFFRTVDVPEPGSMALLGLGLAGLCFSRRKAARS